MSSKMRLVVENKIDQKIELTLEPVGTDHWMNPGETFIVEVEESSGEPFQVQLTGDGISVWVNEGSGWVVDLEGNEIECGHQRPTAMDRVRQWFLWRRN